MKLGRNNNRSLLGIPDNEDEKMLQKQNEELLEKDNDKKLEDLAHIVSVIKDRSRDIEIGIDQSNKNLGHLDKEMGDVQGLIGGAMHRLSNLTQQGGSRHMCYLVLFIVFVFILVYFIITRTHSSETNTPS